MRGLNAINLVVYRIMRGLNAINLVVYRIMRGLNAINLVVYRMSKFYIITKIAETLLANFCFCIYTIINILYFNLSLH